MPNELSEFIDRNKEKWQELETLLEKIRVRGFKILSAEELNSLGRLYRETSADLAIAKSYSDKHRIVYYLNNLVGKTHGYIYQTKPARLKAIWEFYRLRFPAIFRENFIFTLSASLIFLSFGLIGFFTAFKEESFSSLIIPQEILASIEKKEMWTHDITGIAPLASSAIMTNNISVTLSAFALGITFCIGTFYILAFNGLMLGVLAYLVAINGMTMDFWSFVMPHAVVELMCIFIAGGAGLLMGSSLILPGELKRKDALILRAKTAVELVLGCVPFLIVAGIIEAFISPSFLNPFSKMIFAVFMIILFYIYLFIPINKKIRK